MTSLLPIDDWLKPVSDQAPCGVPDAMTLAQIDAFDAWVKGAGTDRWVVLRQAAVGILVGGEIPDLTGRPGSEAIAKVKPVRHLKCGLVLAVAALEDAEQGWPGFADALTLIQRLLAERWHQVHPEKNPDDPDDPFIARVNALSPLAIAPPAPAQPGYVPAGDSWQVLDRMLRAPLLKSDRLGVASLRDCLSPWAAQLRLPLPPGTDRTAAYVDEFRLAAGESVREQERVLAAALKAAAGIQRSFQEAPGTIKPDFNFLVQMLRGGLDVLRGKVSVAGPVPTGGGAGVAPTSRADARGGFADRDEAKRKLLELAEYFRRNEPSSPIPLLLERIARLSGMNFLALLEELKLGKDAVPSFRALAGIPEEPPKPE